MKKKKYKKQVAALAYRRHGQNLDVLLISSRETKRWVIPKGWPMKGKKDWTAAAIEAFEEAGVKGKVGKKSLGTYVYDKRKKSGALQPCEVFVYPLEVTEALADWPERSERQRRWFPAAEAMDRVTDDGLHAVIEAILT